VYTDPKRHEHKGKSIMRLEEARHMYPNSLASKLYKDADITIKYLVIGELRYSVVIKNNDIYSMKNKEVTRIDRLEDSEDRLFEMPIYSIDYITIGGQMVAIDFNRVQKLSNLGIQEYLKPEEVIENIYRSIY